MTTRPCPGRSPLNQLGLLSHCVQLTAMPAFLSFTLKGMFQACSCSWGPGLSSIFCFFVNCPICGTQAHNGSGKTTCFVLGMLSRVDPRLKTPQALCVCPTRELAQQVSISHSFFPVAHMPIQAPLQHLIEAVNESCLTQSPGCWRLSSCR